MVAMKWALRGVHRDVIEVHPETITLGVAIGKEPRLEYLVRRKADPRDDVGGRERGLLHFREEIFRIAIELEEAHLEQWKCPLGPDFGQFKRIEREGFGLGLAHDLNIQRPFRKSACLDVFEEIALIALA